MHLSVNRYLGASKMGLLRLTTTLMFSILLIISTLSACTSSTNKSTTLSHSGNLLLSSDCDVINLPNISSRSVSFANPPDASNSYFFYDSHNSLLYLVTPMSKFPYTAPPKTETYVSEKDGWHEVITTISPPVSSGGSMVYYPDGCDAVLFEGWEMYLGPKDTKQVATRNTWIFDGAQWQNPSLSSSPLIMKGASFGYDGLNHNLVLFGLDDTWEWSKTGWKEFLSQDIPQLPPANCSPTATSYDSKVNKLLLFCITPGSISFNLSTLWSWSGSGWFPLGPPYINRRDKSYTNSQPSSRIGEVMVYDKVSGNILLFGGMTSNNGTLGDTWLFDGVAWKQMNPPQSPPPGAFYLSTFDDKLKKIVLFTPSEISNKSSAAKMWVWDESNWTLINA